GREIILSGECGLSERTIARAFTAFPPTGCTPQKPPSKKYKSTVGEGAVSRKCPFNPIHLCVSVAVGWVSCDQRPVEFTTARAENDVLVCCFSFERALSFETVLSTVCTLKVAPGSTWRTVISSLTATPARRAASSSSLSSSKRAMLRAGGEMGRETVFRPEKMRAPEICGLC